MNTIDRQTDLNVCPCLLRVLSDRFGGRFFY